MLHHVHRLNKITSEINNIGTKKNIEKPTKITSMTAAPKSLNYRDILARNRIAKKANNYIDEQHQKRMMYMKKI